MVVSKSSVLRGIPVTNNNFITFHVMVLKE